MQSYGLACAGSQMAHNVLPHLQHVVYMQELTFYKLSTKVTLLI